jgi:hypothetical protein
MGQLIGTAIDHTAPGDDSHHCKRCGMEKKSDDNGCCKDEVKTFKASPDQLPVKALQAPGLAMVALLPPAFVLPPAPSAESEPQLAAAPPHGPPGIISDLPIYLQVRSLRL